MAGITTATGNFRMFIILCCLPMSTANDVRKMHVLYHFRKASIFVDLKEGGNIIMRSLFNERSAMANMILRNFRKIL